MYPPISNVLPREDPTYPDDYLIITHMKQMRTLYIDEPMHLNTENILHYFNVESAEQLDENTLNEIVDQWRDLVLWIWRQLLEVGYEVLKVWLNGVHFTPRQSSLTDCVWIAHIFYIQIIWKPIRRNNELIYWTANNYINIDIRRQPQRFNGYNSFPPYFKLLTDEPDLGRSTELLLQDPNVGSVRYMPYIQHNSWKIISHRALPMPQLSITHSVYQGIDEFIETNVTTIVNTSNLSTFLRPLDVNQTLLGDPDFQGIVEESGRVIKAQIITLMKTNYFVIACSWYEMLVISRNDVGTRNAIFVYRLTLFADKYTVVCRFGFDPPACKGKWVVPYSTFPPQLELRLTSGLAVWNFPRIGKHFPRTFDDIDE
jgi:hypothetical protein